MSAIGSLLAPATMAHRPPLHRRFRPCSTLACLAPVLGQVGGARAGLLLGAAPFVAAQTVLALSFAPDHRRITLPIGIACGTLAAIGEASAALRHRLTDGLSVVAAQTDLLLRRDPLSDGRRQSLDAVRRTVDECARLLPDLTRLGEAPPTVGYSTGKRALDLRGLRPGGTAS